jgi:hypothetical protein
MQALKKKFSQFLASHLLSDSFLLAKGPNTLEWASSSTKVALNSGTRSSILTAFARVRIFHLLFHLLMAAYLWAN